MICCPRVWSNECLYSTTVRAVLAAPNSGAPIPRRWACSSTWVARSGPERAVLRGTGGLALPAAGRVAFRRSGALRLDLCLSSTWLRSPLPLGLRASWGAEDLRQVARLFSDAACPTVCALKRCSFPASELRWRTGCRMLLGRSHPRPPDAAHGVCRRGRELAHEHGTDPFHL